MMRAGQRKVSTSGLLPQVPVKDYPAEKYIAWHGTFSPPVCFEKGCEARAESSGHPDMAYLMYHHRTILPRDASLLKAF